jgi:hypothetical protein
MMKTTEKLAAALVDAKAPDIMVKAALRGQYDDYKSNSATPIMDLVRDCKRYGLHKIAERAIEGEFDGTPDEAREWGKNL